MIDGRLSVRPHDLPGYVDDIPEEPLIPWDWTCAGGAAAIVLLGIVLLVIGRRDRTM